MHIYRGWMVNQIQTWNHMGERPLASLCLMRFNRPTVNVVAPSLGLESRTKLERGQGI